MFNTMLGFQNFGFRPPAPPAGSVIVSDNFRPTGPGSETPHGVNVANTITEMGFPGAVIADQHDMLPTPNEQALQFHLSSQTHDKETARTLITGLVQETASGALDGYSRELLDGLQFGEHNSVRNFSSGISKSNLTGNILTTAFDAFESPDPQAQDVGRNILGNLSNAFDVNLSDLVSEDPKLKSPARTKLLKGLTSLVSETVDTSPVIADSRQRFTQMVRSYESNNNSVVIAAGNDGEIRQALAERGVQTSADFDTSLLAIDEVTTVGALEGRDIAEYSNRSEQVDIFANGQAGVDPTTGRPIEGTSFSAPRVAAVMASLHATNPNASSEEIEKLLARELSKQVTTEQGESILTLKQPKKSAPIRPKTPPAFGQNGINSSGLPPSSMGQVLMALMQQIQRTLFSGAFGFPQTPPNFGGGKLGHRH